jgi:hypothetical protein
MPCHHIVWTMILLECDMLAIVLEDDIEVDVKVIVYVSDRMEEVPWIRETMPAQWS